MRSAKKNGVTKRKNGVKDAPKNYEVKPYRQAACILCGRLVSPGKMLVHKHLVHGEAFSSSTVGHVPHSQWVRVFEGGSPGLGKGYS